MNAIVPAKPTRLDEYRGQVLPPERAKELWSSMPTHIKPAVFERNLLNALMANPDLMNFPAPLVYREVAKAAALGLLLDPLLGEAYIVPAYNYKTKRIEPQLRVGYKGMCKLARQTGNVSSIYSHEVCAADKVTCDLGYPKVLHIEPKLFTDRGPIVGYIGVVGYKDGTFDFEPMSVEECLKIRDRSDAWKAYTEKKIKSTPWATDEAEMSKKTVLRRLMKRQDQSPELVRAFQIEDEAEHPNMDAPALPARSRVPSPSEVEQIEGPNGRDKYAPGDVVSMVPPTDDPITSGPQPEPEKPKAEKAKSKLKWPDLRKDYEKWMRIAFTRINEHTDGGALETFWNEELEHMKEKLLPPDFADLISCYDSRQEQIKEDGNGD